MYHPKFQLPIDTVTARIKVLLQRLCSKFPPPKTQNGSREKTVSNGQKSIKSYEKFSKYSLIMLNALTRISSSCEYC